MKIDRLTLFAVPLTSHTPYVMSGGKRCETVTSVVLRVDTDAGAVGWGEVCPIPGYLPAYWRGVPAAVAELAPLLLGADPVGPEALMARLDRQLKDHRYAKSMIDLALWDLTAQAAGLPLYRLLGGRAAESAPLYESLTCLAPETMAAQAERAQAAGLTMFQVKIGAERDVMRDIERVAAVREAVGPGPLVYADANTGYSTLEAIRFAHGVARDDVMIEQPCATLRECAEVRRASGLPMKIDESAHDLATLREANALGCLDAVAVKLSKFGGLSATRRARDLCVELGAMMVIEDVWGSDIVTAVSAHLGVASPPDWVLNVCDLSGYVAPRLDPDGPMRRDGRLAPSEAPGHGVRPDLAVLGRPIAEHSL